MDAKENSTNDSPASSEQAGKVTIGSRKFSMGLILSILPVVAFILSLYSLYVSEIARKDVARIDVIKTEWELFHDMGRLRLQYPLMAHLFEGSGELYDSTSEKIRLAISSASDLERANWLLQERALASVIFTSFEETYFLWREAQGGEKVRAEQLLEDLNYFNDFLCNNPRLLWYWDVRDGGKLGREFADALKSYYNDNVLKNCAAEKDAKGPFYRSSQVVDTSRSATGDERR